MRKSTNSVFQNKKKKGREMAASLVQDAPRKKKNKLDADTRYF
jgi:hypothetical protein